VTGFVATACSTSILNTRPRLPDSDQDFYSNGHNAFGCATAAFTTLFNAANQCHIDFDCTGKGLVFLASYAGCALLASNTNIFINDKHK
jgi:hypothetical protein